MKGLKLDLYKKHVHLKDYTIEELYEELEEMEMKPGEYLAYICAEILRRNNEKRK